MLRTLPAVFAAILALPLPLRAAQPAGGAAAPARPIQQPAVLVLAIDAFTLPYVRLTFEAISETLAAAPEQPAVYLESFDASRFEEPGYLDTTRTWLRHKYAGRRIDLVVALGQDTFDVLAAQRGEPWPGARILLADTGTLDLTLPQASGLSLESHIADALGAMRAILPATERVVLIYGASAVEEARYRSYREAVRHAGLEPIVISGAAMEEIVQRVAVLPARSVVIILAPAVDARGQVVAPSHVCARASAAASVPVFSFGAHDLGCGIVGGRLRDWTRAGALVGREALARLRRPANGVVSVPAADYTTLAFDDRQLRRWGISESRLPAGSTVLFREPNLWRDHRALALAAGGVVCVQTLLIAGLLFEHRRRRRAEVESHRNLLESRQHLVANAHLNRRAAMGELATSLAHEICQPLNGILQNVDVADLLLASQPLPHAHAEMTEIIGDIRRADVRANEIIRRMRALLQRRDLESRPVSLNDVARETVAVVRPDAVARDITLDVQLADGVSPIAGDSVHLQQVLLNLVLNALDAVATMPPARRRVLVRTEQRGGEVRLAVADQGTGITAARIDEIFEPFVTTKSQGTGMGMGLAIARSIVEAHGGRIGAENHAAGGATVWFCVPASQRHTS